MQSLDAIVLKWPSFSAKIQYFRIKIKFHVPTTIQTDFVVNGDNV